MFHDNDIHRSNPSIFIIKQMKKAFTLENMETYFNNYESCKQHKKEPITNFCTENPCLKFMCPECVAQHSSIHSNHIIDSIKTVIKKTADKLRETSKLLELQTGRNPFLKPDNTEEYTKQLIRELQQVKDGLIEQIKAYFKEKEYDIRKQTSKYVQLQKKLVTLRKDLLQATSELKMLERHIFQPEETVKAITRANKLDFKGMVKHFHKRIDEVEKEMAFNVKLQMNPDKREMLRTSLNELIGIRNKNNEFHVYSQKYSESRHSQKIDKSIKSKEKNTLNTMHYQEPKRQALSAERLLQQNSFRIQIDNYFKGEPFLHFFEVANSTLHLIKLNDIKQNQPIKWEVIPLNIDFILPSFHRTIATESGNIYLIGGTVVDPFRKSKGIYQYNPSSRSLKEVSQLIIPRSSHSILCHKEMIYICGGMTDNQEVLKKCELFNPMTQEVTMIASCKYPTTNSCLCALGNDQLVKLGGVFSNGDNNDTIEIYIIRANMWAEIDPTIENMTSEFGLLSCSGWAPLNNNQIFIFGGYNEESGSQNSRMSFVLEQNKEDNEFYIKYVNQKNPPIAEGFWNQQGVVHNGLIYCLQNVDGEQENDCLQGKKNILIFNGKTWSTCVQDE